LFGAFLLRAEPLANPVDIVIYEITGAAARFEPGHE
jgi:hypothetical protein